MKAVSHFNIQINMISFPELRYMLHTNGFEIGNARTNRIKTISYL
jgi:hypothetical protein